MHNRSLKIRGAFLFALLGVCLVLPVHAQRSGKSAPVVLILVSGLTYADLDAGRAAGGLEPLAEKGMLALLDPSVIGEPSEAAAYLTTGAGVPIMAQAFTGQMISEAGLKRPLAEVAEDAFPLSGREGAIVAKGYEKRFGVAPPNGAAAVHLSLPPLKQGQPDRTRGSSIANLGEELRKAKKSVAIYGDWRALLVGMDKQGVAYLGDLRYFSPAQMKSVLGGADVTIISLQPRELRQCIGALREASGINLIVASVAPPLKEGGYEWVAPGFLLAVGPSFTPKTLPLSLSKRLYGYVSATDIAPTIASLANAGTIVGSDGHSLTAAQTITASAPIHTLSTLYRQITLRDKAASDARWYGMILAMSGLLVTLIGFLRRHPMIQALGRAVLCAVAAYPLALLVTGFIAPLHVWIYLALALAIAATPAIASFFLALRVEFSLLAPILLLTAAVAAVDIFYSQTLLYRSALLDSAASPLFLSGGLAYSAFAASLTLAAGLASFLRSETARKGAMIFLLVLLLTGGVLYALAELGFAFAPKSVAVAFLFPVAVALLDGALCDFLPSTTEQSASA